jgi:ATP-dependent Zn protease
MASADTTARRSELPSLLSREETESFARSWRSLIRFATAVALLTSPIAFLVFHQQLGWGVGWSLVATLGVVAAFRGAIDLVLRRLIPWPSLFGSDDARLRGEDIVNRRRVSFWRTIYRLLWALFLVFTAIYLGRVLLYGFDSATWWGNIGDIVGGIGSAAVKYKFFAVYYGLMMIVLLFMNTAIVIGPLLFMGITQVRGFEPGDADWGVKLEDVRGQAEAKEEVRRIATLWQSGEAFEQAGGKRERGLLMLGAPGTGKTMLAKAVSTGFNCPIVTVPGSGFAQAFMGVDALIVRYLARKARKLAAKWGGQCVIFIDEIDAVGMRRASLGQSYRPVDAQTIHDHLFYGPYGAINSSGDMILESAAWRERMFRMRAPEPRPRASRFGQMLQGLFPGMGGGGQMALNQLLVVMDGIDNPPAFKRFWRNKANTILDASYVIPARLGRVPLRLPQAKPRREQIYFIGATNVPVEALDPALTRPGRMGRHVVLRTPTKTDRLDIFDLYLGKVAHDNELDEDDKRDEVSRITMGYSPAMIEQVCSMALTRAHYAGRERFNRDDLIEAMTTVESGMAVNIEYQPAETKAVAIHEAGHAVAAHVFMTESESMRLSIRMRAGSLGHHAAREKEERFTSWRRERFGQLVWGLGSYAAELVFYNENTNGVGGDLESVTTSAALMVGSWGMGPSRVELNGSFSSDEEREQARKRILSRFEELGKQLVRRSGSGGMHDPEPMSAVLSDPDKRRMVAILLGQAFVAAYNLIAQNKEAVERIADELVERREFYGDEVLELLEAQKLKTPEIDLLREETWPIL